MTEHLRVNGVYWGLTALCIMGHQDALPREEMVDYVLECWDDEAGQFLYFLTSLTLHPHHSYDSRTLGVLVFHFVVTTRFVTDDWDLD